MVPVKRTYEVEYWDCGDESHHHKSEAAAQKCIEAAGRTKTKQNRWSEASLYEVLDQRRWGWTFAELGRHWAVTPSRARQVVQMAQRVFKKNELNTRLENLYSADMSAWAKENGSWPVRLYPCDVPNWWGELIQGGGHTFVYVEDKESVKQWIARAKSSEETILRKQAIEDAKVAGFTPGAQNVFYIKHRLR